MSKNIVPAGSLTEFPVWGSYVNRYWNPENDRSGLLALLADVGERPEEGLFEFGCGSVAEFGFEEAARFDVICGRIVSMGFSPCTFQDGLMICQKRGLHCSRASEGKTRIAMKAFCGKYPRPDATFVARDVGGLWVDGHYVDPNRLFPLEDRFIFRLRRRPLSI